MVSAAGLDQGLMISIHRNRPEALGFKLTLELPRSFAQIAQISQSSSFRVCDIQANTAQILRVQKSVFHARHVLFRVSTPPIFQNLKHFALPLNPLERSIQHHQSANFQIDLHRISQSGRWELFWVSARINLMRKCLSASPSERVT